MALCHTAEKAYPKKSNVTLQNKQWSMSDLITDVGNMRQTFPILGCCKAGCHELRRCPTQAQAQILFQGS